MLKAYAGGRVFGRRYGSGEPNVLALHGWGRTHADFDPVLAPLDAVALDLPGFGASPVPPEAWGSAEYAGAVEPVLREWDRPIVLLGHSFGGRVAVQVAASMPELVRTLVLTGTPLIRRRPRGRAPFGFRLRKALHRAHLLSDRGMEAARDRYGSRDYRMAKGVMRQVLVRAINESYEDVMPRVTCPVELVWGERDTEVGVDVAREAVELFPDARLTVLAGVDHFVPTAAPDALRDIVVAHLATA